MTAPLQSRVLVLKADDVAAGSGLTLATHPRYKHPRLEIETRSLGALADDHVRVAMLYAGICGTDLHMLQADPATGHPKSSAPAHIPPEGRVFGHEGVGRVLAAGAKVSSPRPGDLVAFASILACFRCDICRRGDFNQCPQASLLGLELDGLFGTVVDVPASLAYDVSQIAVDEAGLRAAACLEPAAVALLACERARVAPGCNVAIFGAGPIGLFCAMLCKRALGAAHVTLIEPLEFRRRKVAAWCDATYDVDQYHAANDDRIDVLIEASGDVSNVPRAFRKIGANGRVVLLGRRGMALNLGDVDHMITQAITIAGSRGHLGGPFAKVTALHRSGVLPLGEVTTQELPSLEALYESLQDPGRLAETQCKVIARLNSDA